MDVVGSISGMVSDSRCAVRRSAKGLCRSPAASSNSDSRARTSGFLVRSDPPRDSSLLAFSSSSAATASRPSFSPRVRTASSSSFWTANAIHDRSSSSSPVSRSTSIGTWRSEQDGATINRSPSPVASARSSRRPRAASRSVTQMLRPSTTPATSHLSSGRPWRSTSSRFLPPRTKSRPMASTGRSRSKG